MLEDAMAAERRVDPATPTTPPEPVGTPLAHDDGSSRRVVHVYDGIEEEDNELPRWWLTSLFGTIAFAALYWLAVQDFAAVDTPTAAFRKVEAVRIAALAAEAQSAGTVTADSMALLAKDTATVEDGATTFKSTCAACHGPAGAGVIGPNLTDGFWLHGSAPDAIYKTVHDGVVAKGMPAWAPLLGERKVRAVAAYVVTIKNTNVAGGKAPQGEPGL
jgi:cytochrome c oxidase cbb3-type subunit 3